MNKFFKTLFLTFLFVISITLSGATWYVGRSVSSVEDIYLDTMKLDMTSFIYYTDPNTGEEIETDRLYDNENRIWVDYESIPKNMVHAFVAIEDERFFEHHGFDVKRIIGAVTTFVSKGDSSYGASTITQQLVKNITGDDDVTIDRKLKEIYRSIKIELNYSKEEIIEFYLNAIYLSRRCNGVQAAAKRYFAKDVSELSLAQIVSIAGITQYPSKYDPISNPENNAEKRRVVLSKMKELGYIKEDEYTRAMLEKLTFVQEDIVAEKVETKSYFADAVINEVLEDLIKAGYARQVALKMLYAGGLKIHSTMDPKIQGIIDEVYANNNNFPASYGDILQSSMIITDPYKGYVLGMAGGRGGQGGRMTLNRATQTLRQPGSTIKPIAVYGPALEYGVVSPASIIFDSPITINAWTPRNSNNDFRGAVTVKAALTSSINIPAVKILQRLGLDRSFDFLKTTLGIESIVDKRIEGGKTYSDKNYSSLALGGLTDGISVIDMAGAYGIFPNYGTYKKLTTYIRVEDYYGNIILKGEDKGSRAISAQTAYLMTDMLESVVKYGTGTSARLNNMAAAGKTGTTTANKDRWFIGFTPYYLGAVWVGYDQPKALGAAGNPSAIIWKKVMSLIHKDLENKSFKLGDDVQDGKVKVCKISGKLATDLCELDIRGSAVKFMNVDDPNVPKEKCTLHKEYFICTKSGLLAHEGCEAYKKRVSALGFIDDQHKSKDGYITNKYCNEHKVVSYSICTESGLLAGSGCDSVLTVKSSPESKPDKVCTLNHANEKDGDALRAPEESLITPNKKPPDEGLEDETNNSEKPSAADTTSDSPYSEDILIE